MLLVSGRFPLSKTIIPDAKEHFLTHSPRRDPHLFGGLGLRLNLQHDDELAIKSLKAFIQASVNAIPTGKQNSMAAHNPPSFVFAVVRRSQLWNLANAFLKPVSPSPYGEEDLAACSARALDEYWGRLSRMYGDGSIAGKWAVSIEESGATNLQGSLVPNIDSLLENVLTRVGEMQR